MVPLPQPFQGSSCCPPLAILRILLRILFHIHLPLKREPLLLHIRLPFQDDVDALLLYLPLPPLSFQEESLLLHIPLPRGLGGADGSLPCLLLSNHTALAI